MLEDRFEDCENFSFFDLVNPNFFSRWKDNFLKEKFQLLQSRYGSLFNISLLESQMLFVFRDKDFQKSSSMELLEYMYDFELHTCFPEVIKLLKLNAVIAVSNASAEKVILMSKEG